MKVRSMKMKIKRVEEIAYGDQIAVELDINGKWQKEAKNDK